MTSAISVSASVAAKPSHFRAFYQDVVSAAIPLSTSASAGHGPAVGSQAAPPAGSSQKGHSAYIVGTPTLEFAGSKAMQRVALAWMGGRLSPFPKNVTEFKTFLQDFMAMLLASPLPRQEVYTGGAFNPYMIGGWQPEDFDPCVLAGFEAMRQLLLVLGQARLLELNIPDNVV